MASIELQDITKTFGAGSAAVKAVDDVSISIATGELYFLLGPSGCGKTTLLRIIAGLTDPSSGRLLFDGRDVTDLAVQRRKTAMVFQNYALWPHMTVAQNVRYGPKMQGQSASQQDQIAQRQLQRVQMAEFTRRKPNQLSGGEQQRVALARAMAAGGEALLLDEPLSNLDARLRLHMRGQLRRLVKDTGITAVYVTHDQVEALSMADRIAVMNEGRIVQVGASEQLYDSPATRFVADFLGEANFIEGKVAQPAGPVGIETDAGVLSADTEGQFVPGQVVTCCVRPERIEIAPADAEKPSSGGPNTLSVRIESSTYLGQVRQYVVRLESRQLWKVTILAAAAEPLADGLNATISFAPSDLAVLSE